jgi:hypothetical protein
MDEFMFVVINAIIEHGSRAVRVFPPESGVLIAFADRIAGEVVRTYCTDLLRPPFIKSLDCRLKNTSLRSLHVRGTFLCLQHLEERQRCSSKRRQRRSRRHGGW